MYETLSCKEVTYSELVLVSFDQVHDPGLARRDLRHLRPLRGGPGLLLDDVVVDLAPFQGTRPGEKELVLLNVAHFRLLGFPRQPERVLGLHDLSLSRLAQPLLVLGFDAE